MYLIDVTEAIPVVVSEHLDEAEAARVASRLKFEKNDRKFFALEGVSVCK